MLCGPLIALSRETYSPFLVWTPCMEGKQAAAHMSVYPFKPLFMQHSHVRREAEWWEFHRDKTPTIVFSPPFVQQLSLAQAVLLKEHSSHPLSTVSTRRELRRSITFTPKSRNKIWLAQLLSVPNIHWNIGEVERIFSGCASCAF